MALPKKKPNPAQKAKRIVPITEDTPANRQDSVFVQLNARNRAKKLKDMGYELSTDPLKSFAGDFVMAHQDMYKSYQDIQKKQREKVITQVIKKNQNGQEYRSPQVYNPLVYRQDDYLKNPNLYRSQEVKDIGVLNENVPYGVFDYRIAPTNKEFWFNENTGDGVTNYAYDFGDEYKPKIKKSTSVGKAKIIIKQKNKLTPNKKTKTLLTDTPANFATQNKLACGTNQEGIMKKRMNPNKKYANGTNSNGIGPNNYIQSPNEVLNDYNIMLAKADQEVANDSTIPLVGMIGGLLQQGLGMASSMKGGGAGGGNKYTVSGDALDTTNPEFQSPIAANGMNDVQEDVEVEGGEMFETPQGKVGEFEGPSHEQGGIPLEVGEDVEEGTKVYSDRLKIGKQTLAERKAKRERLIANLEKTASQPQIDQALKNATQRKMMAIEKEEAADLQFQEQVNNMQAMADNMVKAFGTGMDGIQKMAAGGVVGPGDPKYNFYKKNLPYSNPNIDYESLLNFKIEPGINDNASLDYADPYAKDGVNFKMPSETVMTPIEEYGKRPESAPTAENPEGTMFSRAINTFGKKVGEAQEQGYIPGLGDMASLFGDYLGATSGLKNAAEQRSTDITHTNTYKNAGKESQKQLDNAMASVENAKSQAILGATATNRAGKRSGRNSARGVNQMRGMDWLYDTALQQQMAEISTGASNQVSELFKAKSGVAMSADQLIGEGEYKANMANEAAKDAYYTAKMIALRDQANAVKQGGKDINAMKQNEIIENLMKNYGTYVKGNLNTGKLTGK